MFSRFFKFFLIASLVHILYGCTSYEGKTPKYEIGFKHLDKYYLKVGSIEVINQNISDNKDTNSRTLKNLPISLDDALQIWIKERLEAGENNNSKLKIIINKANVTEHSLDKNVSIKGFVTNDQSELYKAELKLTFEFYKNDFLMPKVSMNVNSYANSSVSENLSAIERDQELYQLVVRVMEKFNQEFENNFPNYFSSIIYVD